MSLHSSTALTHSHSEHEKQFDKLAENVKRCLVFFFGCQLLSGIKTPLESERERGSGRGTGIEGEGGRQSSVGLIISGLANSWELKTESRRGKLARRAL